MVQLYGRDGAADIYTDEVHRLYEAVADGSEVQLEHVPPDLLRELARRLPDNTVFTFVYSGNQIVGFTFWLISDQTFHALLVGMNYDVNSKCELYFNLSYQSIDFGLKRRAQEVCIGQSTDELKHRKLGCYQVPMSIFVKGGRWSMHLVLKFAFAWIFPARPITFPRETADLDSERTATPQSPMSRTGRMPVGDVAALCRQRSPANGAFNGCLLRHAKSVATSERRPQLQSDFVNLRTHESGLHGRAEPSCQAIPARRNASRPAGTVRGLRDRARTRSRRPEKVFASRASICRRA